MRLVGSVWRWLWALHPVPRAMAGAALIVLGLSWLQRSAHVPDPLGQELDRIVGWGVLGLALLLMLEGILKAAVYGVGLRGSLAARIREKAVLGEAGPASTKETIAALGDKTSRPPPRMFSD